VSTHILPCPSWCVTTRDFEGHIQYAKENGYCWLPSQKNCSNGYYYGGLDKAPAYMRAAEDIPIVAPISGKANLQNQGAIGYGLHVRIKSDDGLELDILGHLSRTTIADGQYVEQGQQVGWMGSTGNSTGKHIHWEVRVNGIPVDPEGLLTETQTPPIPPVTGNSLFDDLKDCKPVFCRVIIPNLRVRNGPDDDNTKYPMLYWLSKGATRPALQLLVNEQGEQWVMIGYNEWICYVQGDDVYLERVECPEVGG
jgi:hypothetical protein